MNQKIILSIGIIALVVVLAVVGFQTYKTQVMQLLQKANLVQIPAKSAPISFSDNSSTVDVVVDMDKVAAIYTQEVHYSDESLRPAFEPVIIELTDTRQIHAYSWGDGELYESISIVKNAPNGKKITFSVNPANMTKYGWSKRSIEQEIEALIIQGLITQPSPTLKSEEVEANKLKADQILINRGEDAFVQLK